MADEEMASETGEEPPETQSPPKARPVTPAAALAALGIVFGDLGTSPLYTFQTIVEAVGGHPAPQAALGLLSLVVWALHHHDLGQVLRVRDAGRQPRRGRHPGADVPRHRRVGSRRARVGRAHRHGAVRRGADLWRRR